VKVWRQIRIDIGEMLAKFSRTWFKFADIEPPLTLDQLSILHAAICFNRLFVSDDALWEKVDELEMKTTKLQNETIKS
jgi:hypothetical protein